MTHASDTDYLARLEGLRSAARWLLAAAAGVGALLVAGIQLTGIGALPLTSWRLYVAVAATAVTLVAIGFVIKAATTVLTQEWLTLANFTDEATGLSGPWRLWGARRRSIADLRAIEKHLTTSRHELFGHMAPSLADLHRRLQDCHERIWSGRLSADQMREAAELSQELRRTAYGVVQAANYYYVLGLIKDLRIRLIWASVAAVVGIVTFAYVTNSVDAEPIDVRVVATLQAAAGARLA